MKRGLLNLTATSGCGRPVPLSGNLGLSPPPLAWMCVRVCAERALRRHPQGWSLSGWANETESPGDEVPLT
jgi:hypothetical protein